MKTLSLKLMLACLVALTGGCAATPDRAQIEQEVQAAYNPFDAEYMEMVQQNARRSGARVIWVNPPRKSDDTN